MFKCIKLSNKYFFFYFYFFVLCQLHIVSRSVHLNRLVFQSKKSSSYQVEPILLNQQLNFVMDGWLIAANVSPLYFLLIPQKRSDNLEQRNLISNTDAFISFLILTSWKEIFIFPEAVKPFLHGLQKSLLGIPSHIQRNLVLETIMYSTCMFQQRILRTQNLK